MKVKVWIGYHPKIGIVAYDPGLQTGLGSEIVRLWDIGRWDGRLFHKATVKQNLHSLHSHLLKSGLGCLVTNHGIVGQVAKAYLLRAPKLLPQTEFNIPSEAPKIEPIDFDASYEAAQIQAEASDYTDAWTRSEDEGWFYDDKE